MKFYIRYIVLLLICWNTAGGQVMDLVVSSTDTGNKTYQARNSITFANGYSYTPAGGTMTAELVIPFLNGEISYNYNIVDPSSRTLNTSYIVGTPKGVFDVNALGSAAYSIPIDVPPGIGGLQPNLSIVYNSLSGNGNAGYGWNISGLSAITRAGQDYYHDLNTTSVDLTTNDRFYLDGQRLICPNGSGQYGTNGSVYRTENDIFSKVTCYTGTNGPDKFEVKAKDGMTYQYGYNSYADQTIDGIDQTIGWYLNNITDVYGNYIDFIYVKDNGVNYIAEINYGPNNINFYYKQRLDSKTNYLKGKAITQRLLLDRIEIKYNSTLIRKYEFKYNYTLSNYSRYSVLNEVYEYGINSGVMNSIAFKYTGTDNINYEVPSITSSSHLSSGYILYSGDYNGDGKDDIFALSNANLKDWKLYLANTYGTGFNLSSSGSYNYTIENVIASDLNADGKDDLILVDFTISQVTYLWSISSGTSFSAAYWASTESTDMRPYYGEQDYSADFDGDGVNDCLVKRRYQGTYNWDIYSMGHGTLNSSLTRKNWGTLNTWGDSDYSSDFNGDGKSDIWIFDGNGIKIYTVNGNSLTTLYSNTFPSVKLIMK